MPAARALADRLDEPVRVRELRDRRGLAARDREAVDAREVLGTVRTSTGVAPASANARACSRKSPCSASTPAFMIVRPAGATSRARPAASRACRSPAPPSGRPGRAESFARTSGSWKCVVASTIARAIVAGSPDLKIPEPTNTPSTPSCIISAASAGVAIPPAEKFTTGRRPCSATIRTSSTGAPSSLAFDDVLLGAERRALGDVAEDLALVADGLDDVAGAGLALRADHRGALGDPAQRLAQVPSPAHERDRERPLVDVELLVGGREDLGLVDVVDAERLEDLCLDEVPDPGLRHHGDRDGGLDLLDLRRVGHPRDAAVATDVGGDALERHHGARAGVLGDLRLVGRGDVHDDAALQHLGQAGLHGEGAGLALHGVPLLGLSVCGDASLPPGTCGDVCLDGRGYPPGMARTRTESDRRRVVRGADARRAGALVARPLQRLRGRRAQRRRPDRDRDRGVPQVRVLVRRGGVPAGPGAARDADRRPQPQPVGGARWRAPGAAGARAAPSGRARRDLARRSGTPTCRCAPCSGGTSASTRRSRRRAARSSWGRSRRSRPTSARSSAA